MNVIRDIPASGAEAVTVAVSRARDAETAVAEIAGALAPTDPGFVLLFVPNGLDRAALTRALAATPPAAAVFGCTTAGQITPEGYENDALVAMAFRRAHFRVASTLITPLTPVRIEDVVRQTEALRAHLPTTPGRRRLALVFADGLSKQEDVLVAALEAGLQDIPVFGGSAGDGLKFTETFVLHGGELHGNAAVLVLIETDLAFRGIGFDHFQPTPNRMVVTRAVPEERLVLEINGAPAAQEYARLVGVPTDALSPLVFAENPVLVRNGSAYHVRAIQGIAEGGGLTFLSAIDDGLLLTLGRGKEIVRTLDAGLSVCDETGARPELILGFDCCLRKLEIEHKGLGGAASERFKSHKVVGFNTYGEQHLGVHVNQTFVGIAFFGPKEGPTL
ncbi:MAG: FIST N-terminal domain-containing protein [Albidovulum sp.]|uniref:FIST N-terminal domain-containing protein n=1 Tax=Albidovulum sp. TaxID=1872424 RepID=UPI003C94F43D